MKNFMRRCSAGVLAIMMILSFMPVTRVLAADSGSDDIWVNGVKMSSEINTVQCGAGTAVYDAEANTLTLTDAEITHGTSSNHGIMIQNHAADLQIVLIGENTINTGGPGISTYLAGDICLCGTGSLEVVGPHDALSIDGNLTIDGVTFKGDTGNGGIVVNNWQDITIKNGAKIEIGAAFFGISGGNLTITDSEVTAVASDENSNALWAAEALNITGSTVKVESVYPALYSTTDMSLVDSEIIATSWNGACIYARGNLLVDGTTSKVTANGYYAGLRSDGNMTINSTVEATSSDDSGIYTKGTFAVGEDAKVTVIGNKWCGINAAQGITINGMVTATSPNDVGIFSPQGVTITYTANVTATGYFAAIRSNKALSVAGTVTAVSNADIGMGGATVVFGGADSVIKVKGKVQALNVDPILGDGLEVTGGTWESVDTEVTYKAHTHTASTEWFKDATSHWHECTANDGEKMEKADHTFGDWVVDKKATETAKGSKYRDCTVCGQRETAEIPIVEVKPEKPVITAGAGSTHQINNGKDMTLTCSGKLEDLTGIYVDGKLVDKSNYSLKSGNTVLTLKASYLDTLSVGKHTVTFQYKDGLSADTTITVTAKSNNTVKNEVKAPKTGDTSNAALFISLLILSGGAVVFSLKRKHAFK